MKIGVLIIIVSAILISTGIISFTPFAFANNNSNYPVAIQSFDNTRNDTNNAVGGTPHIASSLQELSKKAKDLGMVSVIVELDSSFQPEGKFSTIQEKINQRANIGNSQDALLQAIPSEGIESSHKFKYIPFMAMTVNKNALEKLWDSPLVKSIHEDVAEPFTLSDSTGIVGVNPAAFSWGYDGQGQVVVILDTGVEAGHDFLGGKVVAEACFSNDIGNAKTFCPNRQTVQIGTGAATPCNKNGCYHGTHVAGIAAGIDTGNPSAPSSGVAKGANIIGIQVFSWIPGCGVCSFTSSQIAALEHVLDLHDNFDISSVNLSLGGGGYTTEAACDADNPARKTAVDNLRSVGIATIASSGNSGFVNGLGAPACISSVVSAGSTTKPSSPETLSGFSNSANYLDLLATGSSIRSSLLSNTYGLLSGTSMAAPHVTGAWAILKQYDPQAGVDEILQSLKNTGVPIVDDRGPCSICPTLIEKPRIQIDSALLELGLDIIPPVITILGDNPVTHEGGNTYSDAGATAMDDVDGVLTGSIITTNNVNENVVGSYPVDYEVSDAEGNMAIASRTVTVEDNTPPLITLDGITPTLEAGVDSYTELGATATDAVDGTFAATVGGDTVDTSTPGTYNVEYTATDNAGNPAIPVTRTVTVEDNTPPDTSIDSATDGNPDDVTNGGITISNSIDFEFSGTDIVSQSQNLSFECSLDSAAFSVCSSPYSVAFLVDGPHTFEVRAIDEAANEDQSPASFEWRIVATSPPYITNLITVYNSRPDLQSKFTEVTDGDYKRIFNWAGKNGWKNHSELLLKYDHVYDLMRVYKIRPDLQTVFPEASNGEDLSRLFAWAGKHGVNSHPVLLLKYHHNYDLLQVYHERPDLQDAFPEAENGVDLLRLFKWAGLLGWKQHSDPLDPHDPIYDLMVVYKNRLDLQNVFPEAENAIDLLGIYCWADSHVKNLGENADPMLVPHATYYDAQCP